LRVIEVDVPIVFFLLHTIRSLVYSKLVKRFVQVLTQVNAFVSILSFRAEMMIVFILLVENE
jgi:hypothetical protein